MREILFRAKGTDDDDKDTWYYGSYVKLDDTTYCFEEDYKKNPDNTKHYIVFDQMTDWCLPNRHMQASVRPETVCRYTGMTDKNRKKIFENDITKLVLLDGEVRYFKVSIKSVVRDVATHPGFDGFTAKVEITGVVFEWNGFELFPCVDTYGHPDYLEMEVAGNVFDNPELLEQIGVGNE